MHFQLQSMSRLTYTIRLNHCTLNSVEQSFIILRQHHPHHEACFSSSTSYNILHHMTDRQTHTHRCKMEALAFLNEHVGKSQEILECFGPWEPVMLGFQLCHTGACFSQ